MQGSLRLVHLEHFAKELTAVDSDLRMHGLLSNDSTLFSRPANYKLTGGPLHLNENQGRLNVTELRRSAPREAMLKLLHHLRQDYACMPEYAVPRV